MTLHVRRIASLKTRGAFLRCNSSTATPFSSTPTEHKVLLDGQTLYINKDLAEAIGWKPHIGKDGLKLSLHGWEPSFFTITASGTDSERLSRSTIASSQDPNVLKVLDYLKDR